MGLVLAQRVARRFLALAMVQPDRAIGAMMHHWHYGQGDILYQVGSMFYAGKPVTVYQAEDALASVEHFIPKAQRGEHGWTDEDAAELEEIAQYLRNGIHHAK